MVLNSDQIPLFVALASFCLLTTPAGVVYYKYKDAWLAATWWLAVFLWLTKDRGQYREKIEDWSSGA